MSDLDETHYFGDGHDHGPCPMCGTEFDDQPRLITYEEFMAVVRRAEDAGLVKPTCGTHDLAALDEGREREFEDGGDPCVPIITLTEQTLREHHPWG